LEHNAVGRRDNGLRPVSPQQRYDGAGEGHSQAQAQAQIAHERVNRGLLAEPERRALRWLAERTPAWITPDHLTAVGVAGAMLVMAGFLGTHISPFFFALVILGLLLNWYGDSLDGTLARYRAIERPHFGYLIDHSCDLISQTFIFVGLGFSPYFTLFSALLALSMYLLMTSYTYLKVMILGTHQLAYSGMGATELRVAIAGWGLLAIWAGPGLTGARYMGYPVLDEVIGGMWVLVFAGFMWMVRCDLSKFRALFDDHGERRDTAGEGEKGVVRGGAHVRPINPTTDR
jgi:archaetidylinositol phosphate synthase